MVESKASVWDTPLQLGEDSPAVRRLFIFNRIDLGLKIVLNRSRYLFLLPLDVSPPARLAFTKWRMSANILR